MMTTQPNDQSRWRIELAGELARVYAARPGIRTIVVGGSPSRNLSDEFSDIDMVVYWDTIDHEFVSGSPLKTLGGELKLQLRDPDGGIQMELYYFGTLIVEAGHVSVAGWEELVDDVLVRHRLNPHSVKSIGGFRDATPVFNPEAYADLRKRIEVVPHEIAVRIVSMNLGFFWRGCILNQGIRRDEIVFYHDAFCMTVKRLMAILGGLNHRFFSPVEPRWLQYELDRMAIKPPEMWPRIRSLFTLDPVEAVGVIDTLIADVVKLVETHMPEVDMRQFREQDALEIRATREKPVLIRKAD